EAHRSAGGPATLAAVEDGGRPDGRIVRQPDGILDRIVEYKDASEAERGITEINVGLYCFNGPELQGALSKLTPDNAAGELYLTDLFRHLRPAQVVRMDDPEEALGINDRVQLARAEAALRRRLLERLMLSGVTVVDPDSTFVDVGVEGVNIGAGTITANFDGEKKNPTVIEDGAFIGVDTMLRAPVRVGKGARTGAGAVVTKDVPAGKTAVGMPARVLKPRGGNNEPS